MNVLITGGCGFIGRNLIHALLKRGDGVRIRVLDNLSVGKAVELGEIGPYATLEREEIPEVVSPLELVVGDILDQQLLTRACSNVDAIVHLAASTGVIPSVENPRMDFMNNVMGTLNCLEAARLNHVHRFVFASSGAPLGEQDPPIHEELVPRPLSPYGASKLCGEAYCSVYFRSFGLEAVALRFGNVYGPRSAHKNSIVAKFIGHILRSEPLPIYGDGNQTRDFIYVEDLVEAIVKALETEKIGGEVFQIATQKEHTVFEIADVLNCLGREVLGRESEIVFEMERKGEVRRSFSDITKARLRLGFEPRYDVARGLEETFRWFLNESRVPSYE